MSERVGARERVRAYLSEREKKILLRSDNDSEYAGSREWEGASSCRPVSMRRGRERERKKDGGRAVGEERERERERERELPQRLWVFI